MNLGKSLRIALAMKEKRNKDLAEALEVGPVLVSLWIKHGNMNHANLERVCEFMEMSVSEFVALGEDT